MSLACRLGRCFGILRIQRCPPDTRTPQKHSRTAQLSALHVAPCFFTSFCSCVSSTGRHSQLRPTALHPDISIMFLNRNNQPYKFSTLNYTISSKKCQLKQHRKLDSLCIICKYLLSCAKIYLEIMLEISGRLPTRSP